ncbi:unnamed protein product [Paramecium primaurelia]|uniref:Uncharacterized protein n=1 Tax=Paramecium primaurelia TaxID=5886 RepID=A0A8S1QMS5_PARPR|nr:unnamed protein product [Paramecium primaurelia]
MQSSSSQIIQYTMSKIEESFLELRSQIESSFDEIDELIDSIHLIPYKQVTKTIESKLELPQFPKFSISEFDQLQQIHESLKPLFDKIIKNRIELQEQKLNQTNFEQNIVDEEEESDQKKNIFKEEIDSENQQIKQSNNLLNETQKEVIQVENEQNQLELQAL